jgi:hypothetical protein
MKEIKIVRSYDDHQIITSVSSPIQFLTQLTDFRENFVLTLKSTRTISLLNSKEFWRWCITHRVTRFLNFVHRLLLRKLDNTTFRELLLFPSSFQWLISKGPSRLRVFHPSPEDGNRSSFPKVVFSSFWNIGRWTKCKNPLILDVSINFLHFIITWHAGECGYKALDLYAGGVWFEPWSGKRLFWLRGFLIFSSIFKQFLKWCFH